MNATLPPRGKNAPAKPAAPSIQAKVIQLRKELNASLVDKAVEVDLTLTALFGQTSLLFVGPPGCAKSFTLDSALKAIQGAVIFPWLMGKFTEPDEIFGPVDILALKTGVRRRITKGKLPEAHVVFLDEFFKASTAIANTLLKIVNERVFDNGEGEKPVPMKALVVASNEYPQDGELGAMFDRFVLRANTGYVRTAASRKKLMAAMDHRPKLTVTLTLVELDAAYQEILAMPLPEAVLAKMAEIVEECITEGIHPSDRRLPLCGKVVRAYAYVCGAKVVEVEHLEILQHMLWNSPEEQPGKVAKIVAKIANPLGMRVNELLVQLESVLGPATKPTEADEKIKSIKRELALLKDDPRVVQAREYAEACDKENQLRAIGVPQR